MKPRAIPLTVQRQEDIEKPREQPTKFPPQEMPKQDPERKDSNKYCGRGLAQIKTSGSEVVPAPTAPISGTCNLETSESDCIGGTGVFLIKNNNECCTRECTQEHELQHKRDLGECCEALSKALKAPGADTIALIQEFNNWKEQARPITECRAFTNDISCAKRLARIYGCRPETEPIARSNILAPEATDAVGRYEKPFEGMAQHVLSSKERKELIKDLTGSDLKITPKGTKELNDCCVDILFYEHNFAPDAVKWCDQASGRTFPKCPFTFNPKTLKPKKSLKTEIKELLKP